MKLSVIIPAYNAAFTIEKCIESVLRQTLENIEIIVINDASTDNTAEIIAGYQNIIAINNKENMGPGASRNIGLECAKGEYIGFVDNDDWIEPDYFEKLLEKEGMDVSVALRIVNHKKDKSRSHLLFKNDLREIVFVKRTAPWAKVFRREFLIEHDIKFDLCRGEDIYPAFLAAYHAKKINTSDKAVYHCAIRESSVSHSAVKKEDLDELKIYTKIFGFINETPLDTNSKKYWAKLIQKRGMISFDFLYRYADNSLKKEILREYQKIFKTRPNYQIWRISYAAEKLLTYLHG